MSSSGPSTDASVSGVVDQMSGSGDVEVRVASIGEVKVFLYSLFRRVLASYFMSCVQAVMSEPLASLDVPNCTLCIIKPHILHSGRTPDFLRAITSNDQTDCSCSFQIAAAYGFHFSKDVASEFLVYYRILCHSCYFTPFICCMAT
jgi:hypothetical protein